MYCPECGTDVKEEQKYCHVCGTYLKGEKVKRLGKGYQKEKKSYWMYIFGVGVILIIFIFLLLPPGEKKPQQEQPLSEKKFEEAPDYTQAYHKLQLSLSSGNLEEARHNFELFIKAYHTLREEAGEDHINIIVPPYRLEKLNISLQAGDISTAEKELAKIGSTCGIELCHAKGGSVMYDFASEYYYIVRALERNNTQEALSRIPVFRRYFHEMKSVMLEIMPEKTEQTMKEKYIDELEKRLKEGDLEGSREALGSINRNMCSVDGCHSIILTAKLTTFKQEEVER
jgi:hypothetical protein